MILIAWVLLMALALEDTNASLQGLYLTTYPSGQLRRMDVSDGSYSMENVGTSLEKKGYSTPRCLPSAVDQTQKLYFTLAKKSGEQGNTSSWRLLTIQMEDGTVKMDQPLLDVFPPSLEACSHTLHTDRVVVIASAVVGGSLVVARYNYATATGAQVLVNFPLRSLGLGGAAAYPSSAFFDIGTTLFVQLQQGVAGFNLTTGKVKSAIRFREASSESFTLLEFDPTISKVFGIHHSASSNASHIGSFSPWEPQSSFEVDQMRIGGATGSVVINRKGSGSAYMWDKRQFALLTQTSTDDEEAREISFVDLNSTLVQVVPLCALHSGVDKNNRNTEECPSSLHYEPFVFLEPPSSSHPSKSPTDTTTTTIAVSSSSSKRTTPSAPISTEVVEVLRQSLPCSDREHFLDVDAKIWTSFLQQQDGFLSKQTWESPEDSSMGTTTNCTLWQVIHWASRAQWKAIAPVDLEKTDDEFIAQMGYRTKLESLPTADGMGFNILNDVSSSSSSTSSQSLPGV
mmetsp:Transcript_9439/g.15315  ORF Transcript_9439/g.15315 Transcript_9439/m.15315 type:complete len:513 (-) Transcript_9439:114-1652(-)